jgi:hypothetical protein
MDVVADSTPPTEPRITIDWASATKGTATVVVDDQAERNELTLLSLPRTVRSRECPDRLDTSSAERRILRPPAQLRSSQQVAFEVDANTCTQVLLVSRDDVANQASARSAVKNTTVVASLLAVVTSTLKLTRDFSTVTDFDNIKVQFPLPTAIYVYGSKIQVTIAKAGSPETRAKPRTSLLKMRARPVKGKPGRGVLSVGITRAGRSYFKRHPELAGKKVTMSGVFTVTQQGKSPTRVSQTFKFTVPKRFAKKTR